MPLYIFWIHLCIHHHRFRNDIFCRILKTSSFAFSTSVSSSSICHAPVSYWGATFSFSVHMIKWSLKPLLGARQKSFQSQWSVSTICKMPACALGANATLVIESWDPGPPWVQFRFEQFLVQPTNVHLENCGPGKYRNRPKLLVAQVLKWRIDVSFPGKGWTLSMGLDLGMTSARTSANCTPCRVSSSGDSHWYTHTHTWPTTSEEATLTHLFRENVMLGQVTQPPKRNNLETTLSGVSSTWSSKTCQRSTAGVSNSFSPGSTSTLQLLSKGQL